MPSASAPVFVPTQVVDPQWAAMQKALETFGGQAPQNASWVQKLYKLQKQLIAQA